MVILRSQLSETRLNHLGLKPMFKNNNKKKLVLIAAIALSSSIGVGSPLLQYKQDSLPDFTNFDNVGEKKSAFFDYLLPLINEHNQVIEKQRSRLLQLVGKDFESLSYSEKNFILSLAEEYLVDHNMLEDDQTKQLLVLRVDIIPPSLALAQAAIESGWGTSRFARQGNNLFGQWCFSENCGLVPRDRDDDADHQVAKFSSVADSVKSYIRNINTNRAYRALRVNRARLRAEDADLRGEELAENLLHYSELGERYVSDVQTLIRANDLDDHDSQEL